MPKDILVASPNPAFGELLRLSLEESGEYQVRLVLSGSEALLAVTRTPFVLVILDSDLRGQPFLTLSQSILSARPEIRLIIIPPENNPKHPALAGIPAHGFINKPFYLPELLDTVQSVLASGPVEPPAGSTVESEPSKPSEPDWLQDAAQAGERLSQAVQQSNAFAALLMRRGGVAAFGGQITQPAAEEIYAIIQRYWDWRQTVDLAKYAHLDSSGSDFLLYVTSYSSDLALVLEFDPGMPVTRLRSQSTKVSRYLQTESIAASTPLTAAAAPPETRLKAWAEPGTSSTQPAPLETAASLALPAVDLPLPPEEELVESGDMEGAGIDAIDLSSLLNGAPSPDPGGQPIISSSDWFAQPADQPDAEIGDFTFPWEQGLQASAAPDNNQDTSAAAEPAPAVDASPLLAAVQAEPPASLPSEPPIAKDDTRPIQPAAPPVTPPGAFSCVLVPADPRQALSGELAEQMKVWITQVCASFKWHLTGIHIRMEFVHLTLYLPPGVSPVHAVDVIQQRTSEKVYRHFKSLQTDKPGGNFWSEETLIQSGPHPAASDDIRELIRRARSRAPASPEG